MRLQGPGGQAAILLGVVLLAAILLALAPSKQSIEARNDDIATAATSADGAAAPAHGTRSAPQQTGARAVGPADVAAQGGALERLPPRPPLSKPADLKEPAKPQLLSLPIAVDAGHIAYRQGVITLPGVDPLPLSAACGSGADARPCGVRSRTELRRFLRGRSIECDVPSDFGEKRSAATTACSVDGEDIGAWVVANGWAKAVPGGPYVKAEDAARQAHLGIWQ
ncbi:thermonuclease family protein [Jiella sp. M17.18]|uniref:thermonuclease family protein n=1 Tax=Jiella sp. M17.18 TaxID=3234247 RepID=UPI0034DE0B3F